MKMSTRSRYAARAMLDLAANYGNGPTLLREVASRQGVSEKYLERIMTAQVAAGTALSQRGQNGGFSLARRPEQIRLSQVVQVAEGSLAPAPCVDNSAHCQRADSCVTRDIWQRVHRAVLGVLDDITLADMVEMKQTRSDELAGPVYHI
jgi:Rrf2 family cysteine metabolism transcriptional repressor